MIESETVKYRKLPGSGYYTQTPKWVVALLFFIIGIFVLLMYRRRRAYLGPDHLLIMDDEGYHESYRFFNFRDIQSLSMTKTINYALWGWIFSITCALMVLGAMSVDDPFGFGFFSMSASICGLLALTHLLKGPTVCFRLETAVSTVELPSLNRLHRARRVIEQLRPLIEEAQGRLEQDDLNEQLASLEERGEPNRPSSPAPESRRLRQAPISDYSGRWHRYAYALLFADGLVTLLTILHNGMEMVIGGMVLYLAAGTLFLMAWSHQRDSLLPTGLQTLTKWVVGYLAVSVFVGWIEAIVLSIGNPELSGQQDQLLIYWASLEVLAHPWLLIHCLFFGIVSLLFGLVGMLLLRRSNHVPSSTENPLPPQLPQTPNPPSDPLAELEPAVPDPAVNPTPSPLTDNRESNG